MRFLKKNPVLLSIFTVAALSMDEALVSDEAVAAISPNSGHLVSLFIKLAISIENYSIATILAFFFCFILYRHSFESGKTKKYECVLGILMALTFMFGKAFDEYSSPAILFTGIVQSIKTFIIFAGRAFFFTQLVKMIVWFVREKISLPDAFDPDDPVKYRRIVFLFILVIWCITYIAFFPGIFMGDTEDVIYMSYNYRSGLNDSVAPIDENNMWIDHHSIFYTVILGAFVKGARALCGNENAGIAVYTALQGMFSAWVLAYSLYKLKKWGVPSFIRNCLTAFFAFFPWIPRYAMTATKDTLFADFLMLYILLVADIVTDMDDKIKTNRIIRLIVYAVLMFLFRKNGLYVSLLSLPFLIMANKKWAKLLAIVFASIFVVKSAYSHILLPSLRIPDGSIIAVLTIPIQQTSRYLYYFPDDVTDDERQRIDNVLVYDKLAEGYNPNDVNRRNWRGKEDKESLAEYMKAWGTMFVKHPLTYVAATANNNYANFYPCIMELSYIEKSSNGSYQNINRDDYFDFHPTENTLTLSLRKFLRVTDQFWEHLPVINLTCTSALYIWILVFAWTGSLVRKDRKLLMLVIPLLMLMLTIMSGPCNGNVYPRFTYPIAMCAPVVAAFGFRDTLSSIPDLHTDT